MLSCAAASVGNPIPDESDLPDPSGSSPSRISIKLDFYFLYQTERDFSVFSICGESECSLQPKNTCVFCSASCLLLQRFWGSYYPYYCLSLVVQHGFLSIW